MRENLTNSCVFLLELSSGVNSHAPLFFFYCSKLGVLGDTCGPVCPSAVFMEMGKGMKVTQNEHRRRTANYEREEGWRGWGGGGDWFLTRRHVPPHSLLTISCSLTPHLLHPTVFFPLLSYLRCCVFSLSCLQLWCFCVLSAVCLNIIAEISALLHSRHGGRHWRWQGLWPFICFVLCVCERHNKLYGV